MPSRRSGLRAAALAVGASLGAAWDPWTLQVSDLPAVGDDASTCFGAKAATLTSGSVLVVGGATAPSALGGAARTAARKGTRLWDPATNTWSAGPPMNYARELSFVLAFSLAFPRSFVLALSRSFVAHLSLIFCSVSAGTDFGMTQLPDGRVMVAGGTVFLNDGSGYVSYDLSNTVEILDSSASAWEIAAEMTTPRQNVAISALQDGSVVAFGGTNRGDKFAGGLETAERWDPDTLSWSPVHEKMWRGVYGGQAVTCANGSVLLAGSDAGGLIYDPASQSFSGSHAVAPMTTTSRGTFGLVALQNGSLLAAGGFDGNNDLRRAEIYMPAPQNEWVRLADMNYERPGAAATVLQNASVLVVGASDRSAWSLTAELWDPSTWRCYNSAGATDVHGSCDTRSCHRTDDGSGVDLQTCQESCGPPSSGAPSFRCVQDQCVELPGAVGTSRDACEAICGPDRALPCDTAADFELISTSVTAECCDEATESCSAGLPATCNAGCSAVLLPANAACTAQGDYLSEPANSGLKTVFEQAVARCTGGH